MAVFHTLRFNFSEDIMTHITYFAKLHQYEDRHTYKANWTRWLEEKMVIIQPEIKRLQENGYGGDVIGKMYKAGRYYFRKKTVAAVIDEEGKGKSKKKDTDNSIKKPSKYITMDKIVLEEMDKHILASIKNKTYTPAKGYLEFYELYSNTLLAVETERLKLTEHLAEALIEAKMKKTYKNRYFLITRE
jgi:hypothetical protein